MLPDDPENTILKRLKRPKDGEGEEPPQPPGQRSENSAPRTVAGNSGEGYERSDRAGMSRLIESRAAPQL